MHALPLRVVGGTAAGLHGVVGLRHQLDLVLAVAPEDRRVADQQAVVAVQRPVDAVSADELDLRACVPRRWGAGGTGGGTLPAIPVLAVVFGIGLVGRRRQRRRVAVLVVGVVQEVEEALASQI